MGRRAAPGSDSRQCHKGGQCPRRNTCRFQHPPDEPTRGLGRLWQFPSDHLPVGAVLEDGLRVVSWNIMDSALTRGVLAMGLHDSMCITQNVPVGVDSLTWRDATVLMTILNWLGIRSPRPIAIMALQECSADFLRVLTKKLEYGPYKRADSHDYGDAGGCKWVQLRCTIGWFLHVAVSSAVSWVRSLFLLASLKTLCLSSFLVVPPVSSQPCDSPPIVHVLPISALLSPLHTWHGS